MLNNKTILITGGSSGIGAATAVIFAQGGANIAITYKDNKEGAEKIVNQIKKIGRKAIAIQADLIEENRAKFVVDRVIEEFGSIDVLVNNAGRYLDGDEWNGSSDIWLKSLQQNIISMMNVSKFALEVFQRQKSGVMVNVSSSHGSNGQPDAISYAAAKAGVINITQSYAKLLAPFGRANSVSPAATDAGYWLTAPREELEEALANRPGHKLVDPKTVAEKIVFLASDEAKDVTGRDFLVNE